MMQALLAALVNSDSPSRDKAAVDATGEIVKRFLAGARHRGAPLTPDACLRRGDPRRPAGRTGAGANDTRPILLLGHRDTVFPARRGRPAARSASPRGNRAYGPGVADMKSGLVINLFLLAAFNATGGHPGPLAALITSPTRRSARPSSRPVIEQACAGGNRAWC